MTKPGSSAHRPQRVLVTGAVGFIGSHVCERLLADGHRVWGLDNFDSFYDRSLKERNLAMVLEHPSMRFVEGDVQDAVLLDGLFLDVPFDAVVHLAARPGIEGSLVAAEACIDVNVGGTVCLLEAMRRRHVSRLVFASSSEVYGEDPPVPCAESSTAVSPGSPYAASKRAAELMIRAWHEVHGLSAVCLRFFSVFGPRQRPDLAFHRFATAILDNRPVPVFGDGSAGRDFVFVSDAVEAVARSFALLQNEASDGRPRYEILNVGSGVTVPLADAVELLGRTLGRHPRTERRAERAGDTAFACASTERLERTLAFRPSRPILDGLASFAEWLDTVSAGSF